MRMELPYKRLRVYLPLVVKDPISAITCSVPPDATPGIQLAVVRIHASTVRALLPVMLPAEVDT